VAYLFWLRLLCSAQQLFHVLKEPLQPGALLVDLLLERVQRLGTLGSRPSFRCCLSGLFLIPLDEVSLALLMI
jgi:hypothetical protein